MEMDKAPLNRAHQIERKIETLNRQKKYDECIQCHREAVELYEKCLRSGENKTILESVQLQKEWNERQIRMLQLKKAFFERIDKEKKLKAASSSRHTMKEAVQHLEEKIFQNFETHDSLICFLAQRGIINTSDKNSHSTIEEEEEEKGLPLILGNKHPKDDSTVIEELKELSCQLRESVQGNRGDLAGLLIPLNKRKIQIEHIKERIKKSDLDQVDKQGLLFQLDDRNTEIAQLKEQIRELELEKSFKEADSHIEPSYSDDKLSSQSNENESPELAKLHSLPDLDISIPDFDISKFKQFQIPEVSVKLLGKHN